MVHDLVWLHDHKATYVPCERVPLPVEDHRIVLLREGVITFHIAPIENEM